MEIKEFWKTIEDYPDYMVSNLGRVKSLWFGKERIMKQGINKHGYCYVILCQNKKRKNYLVHRLVATAFINNSDNLPQVNHKDENKQNNMVSNLEFCDAKYNNSYGTKPERIGKANSISQKGKIVSQKTKEKIGKSNSKPILQFNREGTKIIGKWESARQVERKLNIEHSNITNCLKGRLKSCGGYRWMYLQDYIERMNKLYDLTLKKVS